MTEIPEPPDGSRIEFEHHTDVYAAWRDDAASREAGWTCGDGGEVWCLYGDDVPVTWVRMCADFGDSLRTLTLLVPVAEGVAAGRKQAANRQQRLINALADCVVMSTEYGTQDGGFVANYITPTGPIHRAIPLLQELGITVRPGFDGRIAEGGEPRG
jgi:hypothetical protein